MSRPAIAVPKLALGKTFWICLGVLLWLYFVISHIPAAWGAYLATRSGALAITGSSGTLWSGRASLASVKVKQVDYSLGQLSWTLEPTSLLLLKPCAHITTQMDNQQFDGRVCIQKGAISLSDATASFPIALLKQALPLQVDGQLSLQIDALTISNNQLATLKSTLTFADAKVYNGANWMSLGAFGAELSDNGNMGLNAHVFDVNSPVNLNLQLELLAPTGGSLKGSFKMSESFLREANAGAWIAMFASPEPSDGQGVMKYTLDMKL